ncbi:MAG: integrase [Bacteroidetes bacterium]|nr:MAG: integrase [Bacteroidota bacterium]
MHDDVRPTIPSGSLQERLQADAEAARKFAARSRAENTLRAYRADWVDFARWCEARRLPSLPAPPEVVTLYIAARARGSEEMPPLKVSTLERRLAAIAAAHRLAGYEAPTSRRDEPLHSVWTGIVRDKGLARDKVAPVLTEDIRQMVRVILEQDLTAGDTATVLRARRDVALLLLGFAGALRRSELAALTVEDIAIGPEGLRVRIRRSKGDQEGAGTTIGIHYGSEAATCPVRALRSWLIVSGITSGALFRSISRKGKLAVTSLSPRTVARIVKARAAAAGLDPRAYSGHSLRAGFATQAARAGVPERIIMRHTRHKDVMTLREYIRDGGLFNENPTDRLGL